MGRPEGRSAAITTFSTSTTTGIVLSTPTVTNPVTIALSTYVTNTTTAHGGDAVYGSSGTAWTLTNYGTINDQKTTGAAVYLASGGIVTNKATIFSSHAGISIKNASGSVDNFGLSAVWCRSPAGSVSISGRAAP
jgi:hypothetical protein